MLKRTTRLPGLAVILVGVIVLALVVAGRTHSKNLGPSESFTGDPTKTPAPTETKKTTVETRSTAAAPAASLVEPTIPPPTAIPEKSVKPTSASNESASLDPAKWHDWPVLPSISPELRQIYLAGLAQGNDPHAFSILGDCQSQPDVFMGIFDDDSSEVSKLPENLQETVAQFSGSFNRYSPTVKDGTTEGALLWIAWNDNREGKCNSGETPLDCELRVHRPSIVFIHVGTHYEDRNRHYLVTVLERILKTNAIPVFVTKADNLERDGRINAMIASVASEYHLPLWNFWASVQDLPNHGLKVEDSKYLTDVGVEIHRRGALDALDAIWRGLK